MVEITEENLKELLAAAQEHGEMRGLMEVKAFHVAFGCAIAERLGFPKMRESDVTVIRKYAAEMASLGRRLKGAAAFHLDNRREGAALLLIRLQLIQEELAELAQAMADRSLVEALDALADLNYVVRGTCLTLGLQNVINEADRIVHESNMSKLDAEGRPIIDASGRVCKGPGYWDPKEKLIELLET